MQHYFKSGGVKQPVFILLHGTGGDEKSLLDLGFELDNKATLFGIKGNVVEQGMPRYFRRLAESVYDEDDLRARGEELHQFILDHSVNYGFDLDDVVLIGYSNGANIALHLMLNYSEMYQKGVLFHPMYPVSDIPKNDLSHQRILLTSGLQDPIVPQSESKFVLDLLKEREAQVIHFETKSGHQLLWEEVQAAKEFLGE